MSGLKAQSHTQEESHFDYKHRIYPVTEGIQSTYTKTVYERCFNHFLNHIKIHDLQVLLDFSPKVIKQMLVDYVIYLRDEKPGKKLSRTSIKVHLSAILHFFQINNDDFNLTIKNFRIHLPSDESTNDDRPYTTEETGLVLREADPRSKVAILLLCSTGMRIGALHSLQIGDLIPSTFNQNQANLYKIQVYARTRDKYYTFCTPECYNAIQDYLNYRKRCGEKEIKDKSPLIREQFNKNNPFTINTPRFITEETIRYLIDQSLRRSGVRKPGEVHMSHAFRKGFKSICEQSGMKSINVEMLMGHNIGVSGYYYRPAESDILEDYMTHAADALTISPIHRQKKRIADLEGQQTEEIASLKARLKLQEEFANDYLETAKSFRDYIERNKGRLQQQK